MLFGQASTLCLDSKGCTHLQPITFCLPHTTSLASISLACRALCTLGPWCLLLVQGTLPLPGQSTPVLRVRMPALAGRCSLRPFVQILQVKSMPCRPMTPLHSRLSTFRNQNCKNICVIICKPSFLLGHNLC